jgi:hypothetical protein
VKVIWNQVETERALSVSRIRQRLDDGLDSTVTWHLSVQFPGMHVRHDSWQRYELTYI